MPTLLHIWETKSTGNLPLLPYTAMLMNAFLWFMYGTISRFVDSLENYDMMPTLKFKPFLLPRP